MITVGSFFLGLLLLVVGFVMVWKSNRLRLTVGDLASLLGYSWLDWPIVGSLVMLVGAFVMFNLWQALALFLFGRFIRQDIN